MARVILICHRNGRPLPSKTFLKTLCRQLVPDNIEPHPPRLVINSQVISATINPNDSLLVDNASVCLGSLSKSDKSNWSAPRSPAPDGSYAIFRVNDDYVEILSDYVGSRTIWFYYDSERFIASTSQRAIVFLLGNFQLDDRVVPWMLSSGTLGPQYSWDRRLRRLPSNASFLLNRNTWGVTESHTPASFEQAELSDAKHERRLREALHSVIESIELPEDRWLLPLSGGYDSRALLLLLKQNYHHPRTVTWGLEESLYKPDNDAYVACELAASTGVEHQYFSTDLSDEPLQVVFDRFLIAGEGRVDHIAAYMDGFAIWRQLFESGAHGIIRGDEGFGWVPITSELTVRNSVGATLMSDCFDQNQLERFGLSNQSWPAYLNRTVNETLPTWRDRLYHDFRVPTILAALNDLKSPYIEIVNPLLFRAILSIARQLPDPLRTDKALFKIIVSSLRPKVEFAREPAIAMHWDVMASSRVVQTVLDELNSNHAAALLPQPLRNHILHSLQDVRPSMPQRLVRSTKKYFNRLRRMRRLASSPEPRENMSLDPYVLGFRTYVISRMTRKFEARELQQYDADG